MPRPVYVTTSIAYVNAAPHLGFALELVLADAIARWYRLAGAPTRLQSGTDDNSLKNVLAAERAGLTVRELVDRNAARFRGLLPALNVAADEFVQTSTHPNHAPGVVALWEAIAAGGDLYRRHYRGLYCVGCEQFCTPAELTNGRCPEHGTEPALVEEENWFFRLSRYQTQLLQLIDGGRLRVVPEHRRREVRAFVAGGLQDISVSRSRRRARGWGIPVPGDPDQVVYVWIDALANYITGLGWPDRTADAYRTFWEGDATRIHVLGKGIIRFHAVYWPALLLSAGLPLPDAILVHGYLTAGGAKLSKSSGVQVDPAELAGRVGVDALRYWLLRAVGSGEDADWTEQRLLELRTTELANELGNLLQRTLGLIGRYRAGAVPATDGAASRRLGELAQRHAPAIARDLDPQPVLLATWEHIRAANRLVARARPWQLAREGREGELDAVLHELVETLRVAAAELRPFLPTSAAAITRQLNGISAPEPLFPRMA